MQNIIYKEDKGINFGKWTDNVSRFMYETSTKEILSKISIPKSVADYGGANGNLKQFIPNSISIDIDKSKNPDVLDNIVTHSKSYDLVVIRFVLHYLTDYEVIELFNTIQTKKILLIQFVNNDLKSKYKNSKNEKKYFRTEQQLKALIPNRFKEIYSKDYTVDKEFYVNRLGKENYKNHQETLKAYLI
jgi:hypothetical protein